MKNYSAKKFQNKGFSLIDFAIWITIFSVMVIGFLAVSSAQNKHKNFVADNLEKQKIRDKINSYVLKDLSSKDDISGILIRKACDEDGISSLDDSLCTTNPLAQIIASITDSSTTGKIKKINLGFVPYKTLGLNQEDAVDSNNKFYLFLAHQPILNKPYQYYVFSQPEDVLTNEYVNNIINDSETQNNSQNNVIPGSQLSNCHITSAISKSQDSVTGVTIKEEGYLDILSSTRKTVPCSFYDKTSDKIYYKNNISTSSPSDNPIEFQCFSGGNDYTPSQKCERVCKTFTTSDGVNYNIDPQFFQQVVRLYPANYDALFTSLKISKSPSSFLELKCGTDYVYQVNSTPLCATGAIWNTDSKSCQCDAANYYVQNNQNQCVKGCKMSLDVVGPGNLVDNNKLYYQGQSVSQVIGDTTCLPNASKNNAFFTTEQVVKHVSNQNYCILRRSVTQTIWAVENFKQKLCSCNSGYSMLAENSIANSSSEGGAFYNFPGNNATYKDSNRNFTAKYDCFLMCSATTNDSLKQNVANSGGNLTNLAIGYHQYGLTTRQEAIINSLNTINYKEYSGTVIRYLFYDGTNQKQLQPLNCSASSGSNVNYCLNTNLSGKRLFSTTCGTSNDSLPFLQIKSGGSL